MSRILLVGLKREYHREMGTSKKKPSQKGCPENPLKFSGGSALNSDPNLVDWTAQETHVFWTLGVLADAPLHVGGMKETWTSISSNASSSYSVGILKVARPCLCPSSVQSNLRPVHRASLGRNKCCKVSCLLDLSLQFCELTLICLCQI